MPLLDKRCAKAQSQKGNQEANRNRMKVSKSLRQKYPYLAEPDVDIPLQTGVNEAEFWLMVHSCILYGLMEGDAENINPDQCIKVLERGKKFGILPQKGYISPEFKLKSQV